jgi:hypothetical protein
VGGLGLEGQEQRRDPYTSRRKCFANHTIPLQRSRGYIVYETSKQWYCFYLKNINLLRQEHNRFFMFRTQYIHNLVIPEHSELGIGYLLPYSLIAIPLLQCTISLSLDSATFLNFAIRYSLFAIRYLLFATSFDKSDGLYSSRLFKF